MSQITIDGATTNDLRAGGRCVEIEGLPIANYDELTGGGIDPKDKPSSTMPRADRRHDERASGTAKRNTEVPHSRRGGNRQTCPRSEGRCAGITAMRYRKVAFTLVDNS